MKRTLFVFLLVAMIALALNVGSASAAGDPTAPHVPDRSTWPHSDPVWSLSKEDVFGARPTDPKGCTAAWNDILTLVHKDEAYRFFENHSWCESWLLTKYGIDYDQYRSVNQ